jgi:ATP-dependent RNA helicase RhlE
MTHSKPASFTFDNLGIDPRILLILKKNAFLSPTPIQYQCIPQILNGKDIVGIAQTGTGKTLAFALPIIQALEKNKGQALILVPTRELAIQADEMIYKIGRNLEIRTAIIIGGTSMDRQIRDIRRNPHIIIATPGRLLDHLKRKIFDLRNIKTVVLDEADRMFDIGFLPDIKHILSMAPVNRQTLLFSATISPAIANIASNFMKTPVRIEVAPSGTVASGVKQELFILRKEEKISLLKKILEDNPGTILVFSRTKYGTKKIAKSLIAMGYSASEIHSDRSLFQRKEAMAGFKSGKYRVLIATDIAARGIDVSHISIVVNFDLPDNSEDYVHRIGRTGRAGSIGRAISFATSNQRNSIRQIERLIKKPISVSALPKLPKFENIAMDIPYSDKKKEERNNKRTFSYNNRNRYGKQNKNKRHFSYGRGRN